MPKQIISFILFLFLFSAISFAQNKNKVNKLIVNLKNIPDSTYLYIEKNNRTVDSMIVINGKGELVMKIEKPERIFLQNKDYKKFWYKSFWLEPREITVEGDYSNAGSVKILGSKSNLLSDKLMNIDNTYRTFIDSVSSITKNLSNKTNIEEITLQKKKWYLSEAKQIIKQNKDSYVSLNWVGWQCVYNFLSKKEISSFYKMLSQKMKKDNIAYTIKEYISLPNVPEIGDMFVDFEQLTPENKKIKLSDYIGKITLVEFWGSGCYPCRIENPKIVKLYEQYHALGFNILGVSMDDDKEKWLKAIKDDKLPWINVSDLKGVFNRPGLIYGVTGIPNNFLINKEGIITHKSLRGEDLKNTLEELFK